MGARWRMAIAATVLIALCALVVVAADSEAGSITEAVRLRFDEGRRQFNNYHEPDSGRFQTTIREEEGGMSLPRSATVTHTALDAMGPSQQQALLRKLAAEKRRLSRILRRGRGTDDADVNDWDTRPARTRSAWAPRREAEFLDEEEPVSHSRPSREESDEEDALVEHSSAMFRAAMQAEVKQRAKDRKRQAAIERDEEELEEEQAESFRVKLQEKERENQAQKARLMHQVEHYKRRDRLDQQMIREAEKEAATSAAQAAHDAATRVAGQMEHELLSDVRRTLPQQLAQQGMPVSGSVQDRDLVRLQPEAVQITAQTTAQRDPEVKRLVNKIARLQHTLKKATSQPTEPATAESGQTVQHVSEEPVAAPLIMETDTATTEKARMVVEPQKARIVVSKQAKSARVVAPPTQPVASTPAEPAEEPSVVDVVPEKPLREPVQVEAQPTATSEPIVEGGENEEQAEYNLIAYALWGSVGALVIGLLGTVMYCACQQPRDRPWGMPPKRQF